MDPGKKFNQTVLKSITSIPFQDIESIPTLIKDYLDQKIFGFEDDLFSDQNFAKKFEAKKQRFTDAQREILANTLKFQTKGLNLSDNQQLNLQKLSLNNTFTVTTGHQLNLFTGPLFFVYKILQTIKTADYLNQKFPEQNTVPIFWMASEDHDFAEINHFRTTENYFEIRSNAGGPVGEIEIEDDHFISEFESEFKDSVFGTELFLMMQRAYKKGHTLAQATRILVHELFAEYGLLILDGNDVRLKEQMKEIFKGEILTRALFESTKPAVQELETRYGNVQVNPREINLFYLNNTRNRIEADGDNFRIVDTEITFTKVELLQELENHPEKFSPNALLRPVYQETVLPNVAYVGGNAEIMYWLELKDYFTALELPFPILIPRNSIVQIQEKTLGKIDRLGLEIDDFYKNFANVTRDLLLSDNEILKYLDISESQLQKHFNELGSISALTDKSFQNLVDAEKTRQLKSFVRMRKRLLRAEKIKQNEKLQQLNDLFMAVHPGGVWQERVLNFSVFFADYGKTWLQSCYEVINVDKPVLSVISI